MEKKRIFCKTTETIIFNSKFMIQAVTECNRHYLPKTTVFSVPKLGDLPLKQ